MIPHWTFAIVVGGLCTALVGCVSVPREAGFCAVQKATETRTGKRVHWNQGGPADKEAADFVDSVLHKPEMTAADAVQVALLSNLHLQATYEELGIAQADLVAAGMLRNPTLSAEVRFPSMPALPYSINVAQSFVDILLMPVRKKVAGAKFEASKFRVTHEVISMAGETAEAGYRAQGANQLAEMRRQICQATGASVEAARSLHEAGNLSELDFASQQAMHEQARAELATAEAEAADAREALNGLMGIGGVDAHWKIADRLPDLPTAESAMPDLEAQAISHRTDLAAARAETEAAAQEIGLTKYSVLGDLSVGVHAEKDTDRSFTVGPGVEVPLPIFNQGQPALAAAEARFRQSRLRCLALAADIHTEVRRKRNELLAARQRAENQRKVILPLRHRIVEQTLLHYNAMTANIFQLLQARQAEIEAGRDYVQALRDYWVARAELERAVEGPIAANAR